MKGVVSHVLVELDDAEELWELVEWVPRRPECHCQTRVLLEWEQAHLALSSAGEGQAYHRLRSVCPWYKVEWKGTRQKSEREACSISSLSPIVSLVEYIYTGYTQAMGSDMGARTPFCPSWKIGGSG